MVIKNATIHGEPYFCNRTERASGGRTIRLRDKGYTEVPNARGMVMRTTVVDWVVFAADGRELGCAPTLRAAKLIK